jgi:hypothetical protein
MVDVLNHLIDAVFSWPVALFVAIWLLRGVFVAMGILYAALDG